MILVLAFGTLFQSLLGQSSGNWNHFLSNASGRGDILLPEDNQLVVLLNALVSLQVDFLGGLHLEDLAAPVAEFLQFESFLPLGLLLHHIVMVLGQGYQEVLPKLCP